MKYYYTREQSVDGAWDVKRPYRFDQYNQVDGMWNINHPYRIDQYNVKVTFDRDLLRDFPGYRISFSAGYNYDPTIVMIDFIEVTLTEEQKTLLDTTVSKHKNNVPDKYAVWYQDSFIPDPGKPGQAYLFDTEEQAQQFIVNDNLEGAVVKGVVVL